MRGFVLSLPGIDVDSITAAASSCSAPDVSIAAVSRSRSTDSKFWNRLAEAHDASREGWPDPDPGDPATPTDPTDLRRMLMPSQDSVIAFFVALRGDRLLGYSLLTGRRDTGDAQFASTAVRPATRSQKIATALRARCFSPRAMPGSRRYTAPRATSRSFESTRGLDFRKRTARFVSCVDFNRRVEISPRDDGARCGQRFRVDVRLSETQR